MQNQHSEAEYKEVAKQLSQPQGERGLKTAANMNQSNLGMTKSAIASVCLKKGEKVLEIGPGNAKHVAFLMDQAADLFYTGADISELMIEEAQKINSAFITKNKAEFILVDKFHLPFESKYFDKIYTVNTLYFWIKPAEYLQEIKKCLKPNGIFSLCFADKDFMQTLPFTNYGFNLYCLSEVKNLLEENGFLINKILQQSEEITNNIGDLVTRKYYTITCST